MKIFWPIVATTKHVITMLIVVVEAREIKISTKEKKQ